MPEHSASRPAVSRPVTVTVARQVAVGREAEFEEWSESLTAKASGRPGFLGAGMLRPSHLGDPWHVIFRFDTDEHLQQWETSPERAALLSTGQELVSATDMHRVSGLETWFSLPGRTAPAPPKWKMFVVSAAGIYLLNIAVAVTYGRTLTRWPLLLHLAVASVPVTAVMTWLVMPHAARWLRGWLYAPPRRR